MTVKSKSSSFTLPKLAIPSAIFLLGVLLTVWMQTFVSDGVFFGSDAGLKALLSQKIAAQIKTVSFPLDMSLTFAEIASVDWVDQIWSQGLYPIAAPFAYEIDSQQFISFPFVFSLITAPFYALFGEPGLYIVPMLALWAIWGRFWQVGLRADWDSASLSLGLFTLIFASPLSLYGSTYWEQTLAVALAFWGVTALLYPPKNAAVRTHFSGSCLITSGVLIGLSVWFRPEFIGLSIAAVALIILGWRLPKWRLLTPLSAADAFIFVGSIVGTVSVFFALNYGVYGHFLGLHGLLVLDTIAAIAPLEQAKTGYGQMLLGLWRYFPVATLIVVATLCAPEFKRASLRTTNRFKGFKTPDVESIGIISPASNEPLPARAALVLCLIIVLVLPLLIPVGIGGRQWGPRFYLVLIPLLSLVLAEQLQVGFFQNWARRLLLIGTAIALAFGIHMNTLNGAFNVYRDPHMRSTSLWANYVSIAPTITSLKAQPIPWIATNSQFATHQLWSALPDKTFFRTETIDEVKQLASALLEQDEQTFIFVCGSAQDCTIPEIAAGAQLLENGSQLSFELIGHSGRYPLYAVEITS